MAYGKLFLPIILSSTSSMKPENTSIHSSLMKIKELSELLENDDGSAGPTSSYRMDPYAPVLMAKGLKGMIGKGSRGKEVIDAMKKYKAVYFAATGGAGALLSRRIKSSVVVAYEDLDPEAIRKIEIEDFPVIVVNDIYGRDLYEEGRKRYKKI